LSLPLEVSRFQNYSSGFYTYGGNLRYEHTDNSSCGIDTLARDGLGIFGWVCHRTQKRKNPIWSLDLIWRSVVHFERGCTFDNLNSQIVTGL